MDDEKRVFERLYNLGEILLARMETEIGSQNDRIDELEKSNALYEDKQRALRNLLRNLMQEGVD